MEMNERNAKLSIKMEDLGDQVECTVQMEGSGNALLNAYRQLSGQLFKRINEDGEMNEREVLALYSLVQTHILHDLGIDVDAEAEKARRKQKMMDAFSDIIGKTFVVNEDEKEDAE